jgi:hypothetical protein
MKKFTCDALIFASAQLRRQKAATAKPNRVSDAGGAKSPVDLNEIHRRFWARIAGKE